jgi:hypothetical protein
MTSTALWLAALYGAILYASERDGSAVTGFRAQLTNFAIFK